MREEEVHVFTGTQKLLLSLLSWTKLHYTLQSFSVLFICQPTPKCKLWEDVMRFLDLKEVSLQQK